MYIGKEEARVNSEHAKSGYKMKSMTHDSGVRINCEWCIHSKVNKTHQTFVFVNFDCYKSVPVNKLFPAPVWDVEFKHLDYHRI